MHKGLIFLSSLQPIKYSCLPKERLLDTTISLISILFNEIRFLF